MIIKTTGQIISNHLSLVVGPNYDEDKRQRSLDTLWIKYIDIIEHINVPELKNIKTKK